MYKTVIPKNIYKRLSNFGLILIAGFLTVFVSDYYKPLTLLAPGFLFGLAVSLPHFENKKKQIVSTIAFPICMSLLWTFVMIIGLVLSILNNSYTDVTGTVIIGLLSGFSFMFIYDLFYRVKNKFAAYFSIIALGLASALICDYLFLEPHTKEQNLGRMTFIWDTLIGIGLITVVKTEKEDIDTLYLPLVDSE